MHTYAPPSHLPPPQFEDFKNYVDLIRAETEYLEHIQTWARTQEPHKLAGEIVQTPRGDGEAIYVVVKINGKVSLIHIPIGDAWEDPQFERLVTVAELTRMVTNARKFRTLFASA